MNPKMLGGVQFQPIAFALLPHCERVSHYHCGEGQHCQESVHQLSNNTYSHHWTNNQWTVANQCIGQRSCKIFKIIMEIYLRRRQNRVLDEVVMRGKRGRRVIIVKSLSGDSVKFEFTTKSIKLDGLEE